MQCGILFRRNVLDRIAWLPAGFWRKTVGLPVGPTIALGRFHELLAKAL
jgi:hypothetical protein